MGDYYNATRGPLSVTLNDGSSISLSPKKWVAISPEQENSSSIVKLVSKGFLVRSKIAAELAVPTPIPLVVAVPAASSEAETVSEAPVASTSPVKEEIQKKKR